MRSFVRSAIESSFGPHARTRAHTGRGKTPQPRPSNREASTQRGRHTRITHTQPHIHITRPICHIGSAVGTSPIVFPLSVARPFARCGCRACHQGPRAPSRQASIQAGRHTSRHASKQAGRQTNRQADKQAGRQRQASRQAGKQAITFVQASRRLPRKLRLAFWRSYFGCQTTRPILGLKKY